MSATIPVSLIDLAEEKGACSEAIAWLRERPRTFADLAEKDAAWREWSKCLLNHEARKAYNEAKAPARNDYNEANATAWKAYIEATATAWKAYKEAIAPALKAYNKAAEKALEDALRQSHPELFEEEL